MRNGNEEMRNGNEEMRLSLEKLVYTSHKLVPCTYVWFLVVRNHGHADTCTLQIILLTVLTLSLMTDIDWESEVV